MLALTDAALAHLAIAATAVPLAIVGGGLLELGTKLDPPRHPLHLAGKRDGARGKRDGAPRSTG